MEPEIFLKTRKKIKFVKKLFLLVFILFLPAALYNFFIDKTNFYINLIVLPFALFFFIKSSSFKANTLFRSFCTMISLVVLLLLGINEDVIIYNVFVLLLPPAFILVLGKKEGLIWSILLVPVVQAVNLLTSPLEYGPAMLLDNLGLAMALGVSYIVLTATAYFTESIVSELVKELSRKNDVLRHQYEELKKTQKELRELQEIFSVCSNCRRVYDESENGTGEYVEFEEYIHKNTSSSISHGLCPECLRRLYPEYAEDVLGKTKK